MSYPRSAPYSKSRDWFNLSVFSVSTLVEPEKRLLLDIPVQRCAVYPSSDIWNRGTGSSEWKQTSNNRPRPQRSQELLKKRTNVCIWLNTCTRCVYGKDFEVVLDSQGSINRRPEFFTSATAFITINAFTVFHRVLSANPYRRWIFIHLRRAYLQYVMFHVKTWIY